MRLACSQTALHVLLRPSVSPVHLSRAARCTMSAPGSPSKSSRSSLKKASEEEDPHPDEHALETADVGTATDDAGGEVTESGQFPSDHRV